MPSIAIGLNGLPLIETDEDGEGATPSGAGAFTDLDDAPEEIAARKLVVGNAAGTALVQVPYPVGSKNATLGPGSNTMSAYDVGGAGIVYLTVFPGAGALQYYKMPSVAEMLEAFPQLGFLPLDDSYLGWTLHVSNFSSSFPAILQESLSGDFAFDESTILPRVADIDDTRSFKEFVIFYDPTDTNGGEWPLGSMSAVEIAQTTLHDLVKRAGTVVATAAFPANYDALIRVKIGNVEYDIPAIAVA